MSRLFHCVRYVPLLLALASLACGQSPPKAEEVPAGSAAPAEEAASGKDGPFVVTQQAARNYTAGGEYTASATLDYRGTERITALALQLKIPLGWQFGSLLEGPKPAILPEPGTTDTITLVWITAPEFPATLTYTVTVPDWAEGTLPIAAQAIYRTLGGELRSPPSEAKVTGGP